MEIYSRISKVTRHFLKKKPKINWSNQQKPDIRNCKLKYVAKKARKNYMTHEESKLFPIKRPIYILFKKNTHIKQNKEVLEIKG